jgi:hypothetical protein
MRDTSPWKRSEIMLRVTHRLIIRHPSEPAILLSSEAGRVGLPAFDSDDRHTAEVDYINQMVRERFDLRTTVLRSLRHSESLVDVVIRIHELEAHGDGPLPSGMRWCRGMTWPRRSPATRRLGRPSTAGNGRCPDGSTRRAVGCGARSRMPVPAKVDEIVHLRAWAFSCVLRVRTGTGTFYFKAVPESIGRECDARSRAGGSTVRAGSARLREGVTPAVSSRARTTFEGATDGRDV